MPRPRCSPYPLDHIPAVKRAHLSAVRAVRGAFGFPPGALQRWADRLATAGQPFPRLRARLLALRSAARAQVRELVDAGAAVAALRGPGGARGALVLDLHAARAALSLVLDGAEGDAPRPPSAGEQGLVLFALAALADELGPESPWSVAPWSEEALGLEGDDDWVVLDIQLQDERLRGLAWLVVAHGSLAAHDSTAQRQRGLHRLAGLGLSLGVEVARLRVPARELDRLGPGDVLVSPDVPPAGRVCTGLLRVGRGFIPVTARGDELTVQGPYAKGDCVMTEEQPVGEERPGDARLADELEVELVVEVGRVRLTGAQVLALQPGDVVTLDRPLSARVELRAGARVVAQGELVNVEGETGVRLTEVYD